MRLIGPDKANRIIGRYEPWIRVVSERYGVPAPIIKAILHREMTMLDVLDLVADVVVRLGVFSKKDCSTGYAQIFGYVGLNAANFAVDNGLATYESLGIEVSHRLAPANVKDVRLVWKLLYSSTEANIEFATLNLLAAADEVLGRTDFNSFTPHEVKLVLSRYNANVRFVTRYGEQAYISYVEYRGLE